MKKAAGPSKLPPRPGFLKIKNTAAPSLKRKAPEPSEEMVGVISKKGQGSTSQSNEAVRSPPQKVIMPSVSPTKAAAAREGKKTSSSISSFERGIVWSSGMTDDLSKALCPPKRFFEPTIFTEEELCDIADLETAGLKVVSMLQPLASLNRKCSHMNTEIRALKENQATNNRKVEEAEAALKRAEDAKKVAEDERKVAEDARRLADDAKRALEKDKQSLEAELKRVHVDNQRLTTENQKLYADFEELTDRAENLLAEYKKEVEDSVEGSFNNAIAQFKYFYPDLSIDWTKLNPDACIVEGQYIPPDAPDSGSADQTTTDTGNEGGNETTKDADV